MAINFERLVSRRVGKMLQDTLDLSGSQMSLNTLLSYMIIGFFVIAIAGLGVMFLALKLPLFESFPLSLVSGLVYIMVLYGVLNYKLDKRADKMESILPEYFQLVAANLRSGMSIDRSMLIAARPEFTPFAEDVQRMNNRLFSGESFDVTLHKLAASYRSNTLTRSVRLISEAYRLGERWPT